VNIEHAIQALPCGQDRHKGNPLEMVTGHAKYQLEKKKKNIRFES
jgi:hypothetical protein